MSRVQRGAENVDLDGGKNSGPSLGALADCVRWLILYGMLAAVFLALGATGVDVIGLFRDPAEVSRLSLPVWEGSFSLLGYMIWTTASTACLLTAAVVRARQESGRAGFLAATGTIALLLALDDALLFHEHFADAFGGRGRGSVIILIPYAAVALAWAIRYRSEILTSRLGPLLAAGLGFVGSFALEFTPGGRLPQADVLEEVLELGGLFMFALYCVSESYRELVPCVR